MSNRQEYTVKLSLFEGPLDLLLYVVSKAEVAIADISVSAITAQYLEHLDLFRELNIEMASEYLSMAATLTRLKAREVLGDQTPLEQCSEEDGIYSREQLIAKLLEYKKYREAASSLRVYENERFGAFPRGKPEEIEAHADDGQINLGSISLFDLFNAFKRILTRTAEQEANVRVITPEAVRLDDRIDRVLGLLHDEGEVAFDRLFEDDMRRMVVVVTFLAVLELVKMQEVCFRQETTFGNMFVKRRLEKDSDWQV